MGSLTDYAGYGRKFRKELDKLDHHTDADRPHVKRWLNSLDGNVTEGTMGEYLRQLRIASKRLDCPLVELTEDRMDAYKFEMRHERQGGDGLSDFTVKQRQFVIRRFLQFVNSDLDGLDWADDYELVKPDSKTISADDMLTQEDIRKLTEGAQNLRDIAVIEFLADTGARLSLMGSLRVGDVDLDTEQATYTPNDEARGLKGAPITEYPLIDSKASLRTYLRNTHPRPDVDEAAFFHKLSETRRTWREDDGAVSPNTIRRQLRRAAEHGGVDKPVNPHNFRHSAVTRMAREGYTRSQIEHRVHWTIDTDMWETYEHIASEQHNSDIFAQAGVIDPEDRDGPSRERHPCGNCHETLAPHHEFCPRCGEPATPERREEVDAKRDVVVDELVKATDAETRQQLRTLLDAIDENPQHAVDGS
ncbi:tyrosine-type recombinase/integrase [Halopelagius fulvigenes]|uniref:Tyrosine-type recombinase/integrase n=1 Tax=Halopelagius fulvigenes TaxID=1198324 RepID=A0ABD5U3F8_9EURY